MQGQAGQRRRILFADNQGSIVANSADNDGGQPTLYTYGGSSMNLQCTIAGSGGLEKWKDGPSRIKNVNKAYTQTVRDLLKLPNRQVTVSVRGFSSKATVKEVASGLIAATVKCDPQLTGDIAHTSGG